jgi:hydrogenase maturation protease
MSAPQPKRRPILVIGYGSSLRCDDAIGLWVAAQVARWHAPDVVAMAVPQLLPELAAALAEARAAIFVDAAAGRPGGVRLTHIAPVDHGHTLGHTGSPAEVLDLTRYVYQTYPPSWCLSIPVAELGFGQQLSAAALESGRVGLEQIRGLIARLREEACTSLE